MTTSTIFSLHDAAVYRIEVWSAAVGPGLTRFFDVSVQPGPVVEEQPTTVIEGCFSDQAALHGFLAYVRDMGIPLLSVCYVRRAASD